MTGVVQIDWIIIAAATVTALSVLYYKALRPFWRGVQRGRVFFGKVENLFDMGEELAPEVRNSLFATQKQLVDGQEEIMSLLAATNERIDAHMSAEEESLQGVAESVSQINDRLDAVEAAVKKP